MYNVDDIPKTFRQQQRQRERWAIYSLPWWTISPGLRFWCERQECARISHCSENKALYFTQLGLGWHGTVFPASLRFIVKCALIWWPQDPCMKSPGFQPQVTPPPGEARGWSPGPAEGAPSPPRASDFEAGSCAQQGWAQGAAHSSPKTCPPSCRAGFPPLNSFVYPKPLAQACCSITCLVRCAVTAWTPTVAILLLLPFPGSLETQTTPGALVSSILHSSGGAATPASAQTAEGNRNCSPCEQPCCCTACAPKERETWAPGLVYSRDGSRRSAHRCHLILRGKHHYHSYFTDEDIKA